ncbi:paralemmin-3 [Aplochiton taeniatus]
MDETEKYQQRLQAIAEKRRLQDEQEKAKREMEEERLRLQQLKRKSLRDQWLMEGPPLSPSASDSQTPHSPLWGSTAQAMEQHIDKLESESQRLAEEEGKLQEQLAEGQTVGNSLVHMHAPTTPFRRAEGGLEKNLIQSMNGAESVLTNGKQEEGEANHNTPGQNGLASTNGPSGPPDGSITMTFLGFTETKPSQDEEEEEEEEEEGILVMRAERVIITDEGDEQADDLSSREEAGEVGVWSPGEDGEREEDEVSADTAAGTSAELKTEPEEDQALPAAVCSDVMPGEDPEAHREEPGAAHGKETLRSAQPQSQTEALEGAAVVSVPVYSEAQAAVAPRPEPEGEVVLRGQGPEAAPAAQTRASLPGQFQEVSLAEPQEAKRTEASPGEQEPLLSASKAPPTQTEPSVSPLTSETQTSPPRAARAGGSVEPKHKTCQCCSVM